MNIHWKDWCWSSNALVTWCQEPTHWEKKPWCWEQFRAGWKRVIENKMVGWHYRLQWTCCYCCCSVAQLNHVWLSATPWTAAHQVSLSFTISQSLRKLMSIVVDAIQPSHSLLPPSLLLPSIFPASGSFPMSRLFTSSGQSIGVSVSVSVLRMNIQGLFPLGLTGCLSLLPKGLSSS